MSVSTKDAGFQQAFEGYPPRWMEQVRKDYLLATSPSDAVKRAVLSTLGEFFKDHPDVAKTLRRVPITAPHQEERFPEALPFVDYLLERANARALDIAVAEAHGLQPREVNGAPKIISLTSNPHNFFDNTHPSMKSLAAADVGLTSEGYKTLNDMLETAVQDCMRVILPSKEKPAFADKYGVRKSSASAIKGF